MSLLFDPDRVILATTHAIERARAQGRGEVEPDDLLIGFLLAVSRFGVARIGSLTVDLVALGLRFDLDRPDPGVKPRYSLRAAGAFDRAARVARSDGAARVLPIHFLAVLGEPGVPTFDRLAANHGLDYALWRAALASCALPDGASLDAEREAGRRADTAGRTPAAAEDAGIVSPEEAARLLGMHIQTVRGYIRDGKLPAFRIAGERAIRIRRDDVFALLEERAPADGAVPRARN